MVPGLCNQLFLQLTPEWFQTNVREYTRSNQK